MAKEVKPEPTKKKTPKVHGNAKRIVKVVKNVVESGGTKSVSKAMIEEGYSVKSATNPQKITQSKTWNELMEQFMPESLVTEIHSDLLQASTIDHRTFPTFMSDTEIKEVIESIKGCKVKKIVHGEQANHVYYWIPDGSSRKAALDMYMKIKGKYAAQKVSIGIDDLSDDEVDKELEELEGK